MTDESVCNCGAPTREGRFCCDQCSDNLGRALGDIPALVEELDLTLSRQRRFAANTGGSRGAETPMPFHVAASEAMGNLRALLVSWVRLCDEEGVRSSDYRGGLPEDNLVSMSRWLLWRVSGLAVHPAGADATSEVCQAVRSAYRVVDRPAERPFVGPCQQCGTELKVAAGVPTAICEACGTKHDVAELRATLLAAAADYNLTASEIARAVIIWSDYAKGESKLVAKISKWAEPGLNRRLVHTGFTKVGGRSRPIYRLGDVTKLIEEDEARLARMGNETKGAA